MTVHFKPLAGTFGAEITDFDPAQIHDPSVRAQLKAAFDQYRLLLFRDLDLDSAQQAALGEVFGPHAPQPPVPEHLKPANEANTQYVSNTRSDGMLPIGELSYHHDHLFDPEPVRAIMLYGVEVPSGGGETKFRSAADTYRRLDEPTRALAESVKCLLLFDYAGPNIEGEPTERRLYFSLEKSSPDAPRTWQPLIWRDPRGGDPVVWVSYGSTVAFEGVSFEEGQELLGKILDQAGQVEEYVHTWRVGDALIWNNLHLQHARLPFDPAQPRTLRRTTIM